MGGRRALCRDPPPPRICKKTPFRDDADKAQVHLNLGAWLRPFRGVPPVVPHSRLCNAAANIAWGYYPTKLLQTRHAEDL